MRRGLHITAGVGALLVLGLAGGGWWAYGRLSASLPRLDGQLKLAGLGATVTVERDGLGVPSIRGRSRQDVARATGFLHAQDRFFQMDLSRRRAAGELAALVGPQALPVDRRARVHRLRPEARTAVALLSHEDQGVLQAYVEGVNAGLQALAAPPFEYTLLRQDPVAWRPEDTMLVVLSMFLTLQDEDGEYESTLATMHEVLPPEMFDLMAPAGTEWDAPVVGLPFETPPVPGAEVYNLRRMRTGKPEIELPDRSDIVERDGRMPWDAGEPDVALGSNNWAVAGNLTRNGGALVANDMHLAIRVPNTWYRARLEWPDEVTAEPHVVVGTTLPGVPSLVTGSNTHVAWGFTNTYADWTDLVLLDLDPTDSNRYKTPDGWQRFTQYNEEIAVAGQNTERLTVRWTIWGPVVGTDFMGRLRAARWVGHATDRLGASLMPLERVRTLEEAFEAANGAGVPGQNLVLGERSGRIGWTIFGSIPNRVGFDGQLAVVVGRRVARLERLAPPRRLPAADRPARRPHLDRERPGGGRRHAGPARRRQLRSGFPGNDGPRSPAGPRLVHAARHAGHPARRAGDVPGPLARFDPGAPDRGCRRRRPGAAAVPRHRRQGLVGTGVAGLSGLPADADVPRPGDGPGDLVRARRVLRSRRQLRLHLGA